MEDKYITYGIGAAILGTIGYLLYLKSKPEHISSSSEPTTDVVKSTTDIVKSTTDSKDVVKTTTEVVKDTKVDIPPINLGTILGIQQALIANAYPVLPSGLYDESTRQAIKSFQSANGLKADAIVGPNTRTALAKGLDAKGIPYINDKSTVLIKGVHGRDPYHYAMYGWY